MALFQQQCQPLPVRVAEHSHLSLTERSPEGDRACFCPISQSGVRCYLCAVSLGLFSHTCPAPPFTEVIVWWVDPGWMSGAHQSHSITPPSSAGQRRENITKGSWVEIRTGSGHLPITVTGKTDSVWGKLTQFITNQPE